MYALFIRRVEIHRLKVEMLVLKKMREAQNFAQIR